MGKQLQMVQYFEYAMNVVNISDVTLLDHHTRMPDMIQL